MRVRWRRRRDLAERLRPYLPDGITSEPVVDADPIRMFLYRWMIETGDPIEVVAQGFDLPVDQVDAIIQRRTPRLGRSEASAIKAKLGLAGELVKSRPSVQAGPGWSPARSR